LLHVVTLPTFDGISSISFSHTAQLTDMRTSRALAEHARLQQHTSHRRTFEAYRVKPLSQMGQTMDIRAMVLDMGVGLDL
jgi:hypothetical protein